MRKNAPPGLKRKEKNDRREGLMKRIVKRYILSLVLLFVFGSVLHGAIQAAEPDIVSQNESADEVREVDKFQYKLEGRPDPFLPFLSKNSGADKIDEGPAGDPEKPLTGMQLFEPGQLKLVALLKIGNKNVAMVQDVTGKGYRLDENMPIGRYGMINRITEEQIEITEKYTTKTGRLVTKDITMRLKKE